MKESKEKTIINYIDSYNAFDADGMVRDLDQRVIFENVTNGEVDMKLEGIKAFREQAEAAKKYFRERKQVAKSWNFQGNRVTVEIAYTGVLNIELPNGMQPGDTLELSGKSTFTFDGDKIVRIVDES